MSRFSRLMTILLLSAAPLSGQHLREVPEESGQTDRDPKWIIGANFQYANAQGEFAQFVKDGWGAAGNLSVYLGHRRRVGVRFYTSWIQYGRSTEQLPLSPSLPGIAVDVTTSNNIYSFGVGPELVLTSGKWRPYLHGLIGASYFETRTTADVSGGSGNNPSTANFKDWTFLWSGGGGIQLRLSRGLSHGNNPIWLDLGLRYQSHGQTRYLRKGSIVDLGGGAIGFTPIQSKTDLVVSHLGVQIGL
jgi:hypothetical protein